MKPYFTTPITSLAEAHGFFDQLTKDGLLFHPEDSPESVVDAWGLALFTPEECVLLTQRMDEVYTYDQDPCAYCVDLIHDEEPEGLVPAPSTVNAVTAPIKTTGLDGSLLFNNTP